MTNERRVLIHKDSEALTAALAARFLTKTLDLLDEFDRVNIVLEGGRVGIAVLESINASPARDSLDWSRVHFWWGDERYVAADSDDRSDLKARAALLDHVQIPAENIHAMPSTDSGLTLDEAAQAYSAELNRFADSDATVPRFDITFLGVGPDGHTASLFPGFAEVQDKDHSVLPVRNSPKPPSDRITLTRSALNSSQRVWVELAGAEKATSLGLALAGASYADVPIAGIKGRRRTVFFIDQAAAAEVPENLITQSY
ncbi:6-phosphogluconolactonase [Mycetocola spongiae]|uniref:6-phosphogluconolactonase n=1 Tax=Mycetocola spongiae TaxID=2859226 RepID=UPI001CF2B477|nr:6-phosphogluconolactonase [Mycetocola spongiae]UCR90480.1 6-phosphogluconolactonase [Mycetocola spongiae]